MKIKVCLIGFLIVSLNAFGQTRYGFQFPENLILSKVSLSGDFYVGIDNPIKFGLSNYHIDSIEITTNNGVIYLDSTSLNIMPARTGSIRFLIYQKNIEGNTYLGHSLAKARQLPEPRLMIDSILVDDSTHLSKIDLLNSDSLSVHITDDIPNSQHWYSIKEFTFGYNYGGYYISCNNIGNIILGETKALISQMSPNRSISINAIIKSNTKITKALPVSKVFIY